MGLTLAFLGNYTVDSWLSEHGLIERKMLSQHCLMENFEMVPCKENANDERLSPCTPNFISISLPAALNVFKCFT